MRRGTLERPGKAKPKVSLLLDLELSSLGLGKRPEVRLKRGWVVGVGWNQRMGEGKRDGGANDIPNVRICDKSTK